MERERERKELWHQLDNESDRAHEAFRTFMLLPPAERSLIRTWREWSANPAAKREPPYFAGWAKTHAWSDRARAHDHHIEVIRESGMEEAIREEAARQARQVELVRGRFNELLARSFHEAIEYLESGDFVTNLRPADVVQILRIHLETMHKLGGSETDTPGGAPAVDWTEDEQRELDRLLDEIDAEEEKREKPKKGSGEGNEGSDDADESD